MNDTCIPLELHGGNFICIIHLAFRGIPWDYLQGLHHFTRFHSICIWERFFLSCLSPCWIIRLRQAAALQTCATYWKIGPKGNREFGTETRKPASLYLFRQVRTKACRVFLPTLPPLQAISPFSRRRDTYGPYTPPSYQFPLLFVSLVGILFVRDPRAWFGGAVARGYSAGPASRNVRTRVYVVHTSGICI